MNDTKLIISLKVPQIIKEFIAATNGSAIIRPEKSDQIGRASCRERVCQYV